MLLDALKDFSWYNEPENVRFTEDGMQVEVRGGTDFWQNAPHNFHKDDGHFFFVRQENDFTLTLRWHAEALRSYAQCGIMVRSDNLNWAKAGILSPSSSQPQLGSIVTNCGCSDWASMPLADYPADVWYRLRCRDGDFIIDYSLDGNDFSQLRLFRLINNQTEIKAGAYACSPRANGFYCTLRYLDIS